MSRSSRLRASLTQMAFILRRFVGATLCEKRAFRRGLWVRESEN